MYPSSQMRFSCFSGAAVAAATALFYLATASPAARAEERLVEWNFSGLTPDSTIYPAINGTHSTGSLGKRADSIYSDLTRISTGVGNGAPSLTILTLARSLTQSHDLFLAYLRLSVTPESGYRLNLTSLSFDLAVNNNPLGTWNGGGPAYGAVAVYGRQNREPVPGPDTYTALLGTGAALDFTQNDRYGDFIRTTIDLTGARYQGITNEDLFGLYFASTGATEFPGGVPSIDTLSDTITIDNIVLTGTAVRIQDDIAAPEPASLALLLPVIAVTGTVIRKQRKR